MLGGLVQDAARRERPPELDVMQACMDLGALGEASVDQGLAQG